jgi:hypothetical protein
MFPQELNLSHQPKCGHPKTYFPASLAHGSYINTILINEFLDVALKVGRQHIHFPFTFPPSSCLEYEYNM